MTWHFRVQIGSKRASPKNCFLFARSPSKLSEYQKVPLLDLWGTRKGCKNCSQMLTSVEAFGWKVISVVAWRCPRRRISLMEFESLCKYRIQNKNISEWTAKIENVGSSVCSRKSSVTLSEGHQLPTGVVGMPFGDRGQLGEIRNIDSRMKWWLGGSQWSTPSMYIDHHLSHSAILISHDFVGPTRTSTKTLLQASNKTTMVLDVIPSWDGLRNKTFTSKKSSKSAMILFYHCSCYKWAPRITATAPTHSKNSGRILAMTGIGIPTCLGIWEDEPR